MEPLGGVPMSGAVGPKPVIRRLRAGRNTHSRVTAPWQTAGARGQQPGPQHGAHTPQLARTHLVLNRSLALPCAAGALPRRPEPDAYGPSVPGGDEREPAVLLPVAPKARSSKKMALPLPPERMSWPPFTRCPAVDAEPWVLGTTMIARFTLTTTRVSRWST
jgi:hypothetical protein